MKTKNEKHWLKIYSTLSENQKRWFAAQRAIELGRGGVSSVSVLTEMSQLLDEGRSSYQGSSWNRLVFYEPRSQQRS